MARNPENVRDHKIMELNKIFNESCEQGQKQNIRAPRECFERVSTTIGFVSTCSCSAELVPGIIYDPFMGAGTTVKVALRADRNFIGSEINPEYCEIANKRISAQLNQTKLEL